MPLQRSTFVVLAILAGTTLATNEASSSASATSVEAMAQVFSRSEKAHAQSMANIMKSMSQEKAWHVLEKNNLTTPALIEVARDVLGKQTHLRKQTPPKGYAGLDGARKLLNQMIYEAMVKYDKEIAKCTEYYAEQCALMEACRGQIAASNFIAANSRSLILDAQSRINRCEVDIPTRKLELKQHNAKCARELKKMKARLAIILGDIEVMTVILTMTDCDSKSYIQRKKLDLLRCEDPCSKKSFITFKDDALEHKISQLRATTSNKLVQDTFADLFEGVESLESVTLMQVDANVEPVINKTKFNNPPVPRTKVPMNPCRDPNGGAPSLKKGAAGCKLTPGSCYKLQERFLLIQSGIKDDRDDLMYQIEVMEQHCEETKKTLETQIANDQEMLDDAQTKLGFATEKEASAGETADNTAKEHDQLDTDLKKQMKECTGNYLSLESEMCALKKIRGELMKMKGDGHTGFFQDCEVSKWQPEECDKECTPPGTKGGEQKLERSVLTQMDGGAKCLPLEALRKCNLQPCPVDCKLEPWSGWSKCSAECNGGLQQRLREVKRAMRYDGKPCGSVSETRACNSEACDKPCELHSWTKWTACSKDCDGGTQKRQRHIKKKATGNGACASAWDSSRLEWKRCAMERCVVPQGKQVLPCNRTLDVVFLIDGSGSLGEKGWKSEIKAAQMFVDAFSGSGAQTKMAVLLYSGPRTWSGVRNCFKNIGKDVMEKVCRIKTVTHFTDDMSQVKKFIGALQWPKGSTLTSLALLSAKAELQLGRKQAESVVVVITDGRPLSFRATKIVSRSVRKVARLVWVPVTRYAPLSKIKSWATRRWQENVVEVKTFEDLEKPDPVNHVIANICPSKKPVVEMSRR